MTSEEKKFLKQAQDLENLASHMIADLGFTAQELSDMTRWLQNDQGLPVIPTPYQAFCMLGTVVRAMHRDIVEKKIKIKLTDK